MSVRTEQRRPLVVDLDGTLIRSDLLVETTFSFVRKRPSEVPQLVRAFVRGKAALKRFLARDSAVDVARLPFEEAVLTLMRSARREGREVILATASDRNLAEAVAAHVGGFDDVIATDNGINMSGERKGRELMQRFGRGGFDYVGNGRADLPVLAYAYAGYLVGPTRGVARAAASVNPRARVIAASDTTWLDWVRALRVHQWAKNLLVFLPMIAAHRVDAATLFQAGTAFILFCLLASSVYLINDLFDLPEDRRHASKRRRPVASGRVSIVWTALVALLLLATGIGAAASLMPAPFTATLAVYAIVTLAYSLRIKRQAMADVLTLALLYTIRVVAGGTAIEVPITAWMLAFTVFAFLSLALVKRYAELIAAPGSCEDARLDGRPYLRSDKPLLSSFGAASGYLSALVLALYINDPATTTLYSRPTIIWLVLPMWLYWLNRAWWLAHRGNMHDDPVLFAIKDRQSYLIGAAMALVFVAAL